MSLHKKTLLIISLTICALSGLLYVTARAIVLRGFLALEEKNIHQYIAQARNKIFDEIAALNGFVLD